MKTNDGPEPFAELERGVHAALETYANVHRGSGHNSLASTHLYEQAREIVLEHLGLNQKKYTVIFCSPRKAEALKAQLESGKLPEPGKRGHRPAAWGQGVGRQSQGAAQRRAPQSGGGTARLVSPGWVIWAKAPDKFEAGTPAIVNVIAFAVALRLIQRFGKDAFQDAAAQRAARSPEN